MPTPEQALDEMTRENQRLGLYDGTQTAHDRLICAAPELLAALEALYVAAPTAVDCKEFHHSRSERHTALEECKPAADYLAALAGARIAIAKATGATP